MKENLSLLNFFKESEMTFINFMGVHEEKGQVQEGIGLGAFKGFVTFEKNLGFSIYFSIKLSAYLL